MKKSFIAHELPHGVIGLITAGIFAAAMGSLSSSLNSVAAIAASDFLGVLRPDLEASHGVTLGRWVTFAGGLFATLMAMWVASLDSTSLWDQAVRLLALFGGPLPGVFALGMLTRRANSRGVIIGAVASIAGTIWIQNFTTINSFFHAFLAFVISMVVGYLASLWPRQLLDAAKVQGLTIWDLGSVGTDGKLIPDQSSLRPAHTPHPACPLSHSSPSTSSPGRTISSFCSTSP